MSLIYDYTEAGFRVFGIHGVDSKGACECGHPGCSAILKHPRISNWQNVPHWSDEQMETFETLGHFNTGFGVICSGYLIIDVDARNGGVKSFKQLCKDVPAACQSAFVVNTGSGNGSQHHYFKLTEPVAMVQSHNKYPGIDFKTSGYVIGAGSLHASGMTYEVQHGYPQDIKDAPNDLVALLRKPERHRVFVPGGEIDVSTADIRELLTHIPNDDSVGHEVYVRVGMAIHDTLGGLPEGLDLWDEWARKSPRYAKNGGTRIENRWHSFGKGSTLATYGTLMHYAREGGYVDDVTFEYVEDVHTDTDNDEIDTTSVDLLRPPGFVGELCQWINDQCLYPRETLSVAAALSAVSALAGMRFVDELDGMTANLIAFCVAGSGTGKEAVQQSYFSILREAGIQGAVHGGIKSEQELYRNLIRHQAAFYSVDELGLVLRKLENASKRGGASYLEGVIGTIMSVYSKANGFLPVTGDLKEEIRESLTKELSRVEKRLNDLPADSASDIKRERLESESERVREALEKINDGLDSPYLNVLGYTTPVTFNDLMTFEQATNGFMARAMIFTDLETNPKRKTGFKKPDMPEHMKTAIRNLWAPGVYDMTQVADRVEYRGLKVGIPTDAEAKALLDRAYEYFHNLAEQHKSSTGLEAIPRRGYELTSKTSLLLAMPGGFRTADHIRWAFTVAKRDVELKIKMAYATVHAEEDNGLAARVLSLVTKDHGETQGVIKNRLRGVPSAQVETLLKTMVDRGMLRIEEDEHKGNKKKVLRYYEL